MFTRIMFRYFLIITIYFCFSLNNVRFRQIHYLYINKVCAKIITKHGTVCFLIIILTDYKPKVNWNLIKPQTLNI